VKPTKQLAQHHDSGQGTEQTFLQNLVNLFLTQGKYCSALLKLVGLMAVP